MGIIDKFRVGVGKATDWMRNLKDKFSASISKVQGWVGTAFEVAKNGSTFTGINYDSIGKIREAIKQYVIKIQTEVNKINTDLKPDDAIKGDVAPAAVAYIEAVTKVANAYVSSLLAYSDKMYEYGEAFKKNESNLAQSVKDEASSLSSSAEEYSEKY